MAQLAPATDRVVRTAVDGFLAGERGILAEGEWVFDTKRSRYRLLDGVLFAANDASLVGAELVGWLVDRGAGPIVETAWCEGSRAVLVDRRKNRHIVVTSGTRGLARDGRPMGGSAAARTGSPAIPPGRRPPAPPPSPIPGAPPIPARPLPPPVRASAEASRSVISPIAQPRPPLPSPPPPAPRAPVAPARRPDLPPPPPAHAQRAAPPVHPPPRPLAPPPPPRRADTPLPAFDFGGTPRVVPVAPKTIPMTPRHPLPEAHAPVFAGAASLSFDDDKLPTLERMPRPRPGDLVPPPPPSEPFPLHRAVRRGLPLR